MPNYKELYYHLFGTLANVLEQLDQQNYGQARQLLIQAMQNAEETFLTQSEHN